MKKIGLLILMLAAAGAFFIWASNAVIAENKETEPIQRAVFKVDNITCGACFSNINAGLAPLEGFSGMGANMFRKRVAVDFTGPLSAQEIGDTITRQGYPATLESMDPISDKESFAFLNTQQKGAGFGGGCCSGGGSEIQAPQASKGLPQGGSCCVRPGGSPALSPPATDSPANPVPESN